MKRKDRYRRPTLTSSVSPARNRVFNIGSAFDSFGLVIFDYVADKAKTVSSDSSNDLLVRSIVPKRASRRMNAGVERRVGYDTSLPDAVENLMLAYYAVAVLDQKSQEPENLGLDMAKLPLAPQFKTVRIESEIFEIEDQLQWPRRK